MIGSENIQLMYPEIFDQLLTYVEYAVKPPKFGKVEAKSVTAIKGIQVSTGLDSCDNLKSVYSFRIELSILHLFFMYGQA